MLALDDDTGEFHARFARDSLVGASARALVGYRPLRRATVAHAVVRALAGQLVEARRALALERAICRACGDAVATQRALRRLSPVELRRLGLAQHRATALWRLAATIDFERLHDFPTEMVRRRLVREPAIGPWSVGVIAMEGLGRYDHAIVGDLSLVKLQASLTRPLGGGPRDGGAARPVRGVAGARRRDPSAGLGEGPRSRRIGGRRTHRPAARTSRCIDFGMAIDERRIAILGAGRIGESLIIGLLSSGWRRPDEIVASGRRPERVAELAERHGIVATVDNTEAAARAALVVVAVKPQDIEALLGEIGPAITSEQTVLSIVAATPTSAIEQRLASGVPVVRAMPNTPSTVHEGIAGLCAGAHADDPHVTLAEEALAHLGSVVRVPERHMDAVTAVSGSGPAYFALLAEAMIEAGLLLGLSREISTQLVVQTMLGTAKQLRDERMHPVELREMVTSPGGTTIAAIRVLEEAGVRAAFLNAIQAAMTRARELAAGAD